MTVSENFKTMREIKNSVDRQKKKKKEMIKATESPVKPLTSDSYG